MSESTLVKMPHCWKSHAMAHIFFFFYFHTLRVGGKGWPCIISLSVQITFINICCDRKMQTLFNQSYSLHSFE